VADPGAARPHVRPPRERAERLHVQQRLLRGAVAGSERNYILPYMKAQPYWNVDLSLFKNFNLGGAKKLQFRASAYNVLNHPIAFPDTGTNLTLKFDHGKLANANDFGRLPQDNKFGRRIVQL